MPLDDTNWPAASAGAPAEDMRLAGRDQQAGPAGSVAVVPAGNAHRAGKEQSDRAGKEPDRAGATLLRAGAVCPSSAGGEQQPSRPAAKEIDETTALLTPPAAADDATRLLIRARSFLERGWCRFAFALDADGGRVWVKSERAVAWCMHGALTAADTYANSDAMGRVQAAIGGETMTDFNDRQENVEPVLAAVDRAISAAPVEG